jgi:hypothetical protein
LCRKGLSMAVSLQTAPQHCISNWEKPNSGWGIREAMAMVAPRRGRIEVHMTPGRRLIIVRHLA